MTSKWEEALTRNEQGVVTEIHISQCPNLQERPLLALPFQEVPQLQVLDLSRAQLGQLPATLGSLVHLEKLILEGCTELATLPDEIGELGQNLSELDLSCCTYLKKLPNSIGKLQRLKHLNLGGCEVLSSLPRTLGSMKSLESLNMTSCYSLQEIPPSIGRLSHLRELHLSWCTTTRGLPKEIEELSNLQLLDMRSSVSVGQIIFDVGRLTELTVLRLGKEEIDDVAASTDSVPLFDVLATQIGDMKSLKEFVLVSSDQLFKSLSEKGSIQQLESLHLSSLDHLATLPPEIRQLTRLRKLHLEDCYALQSLPREIGQLHDLRELAVVACIALKFLPGEIGHLVRLQEVGLLSESLFLEQDATCRLLSTLPPSVTRIDIGPWEGVWESLMVTNLPPLLRELVVPRGLRHFLLRRIEDNIPRDEIVISLLRNNPFLSRLQFNGKNYVPQGRARDVYYWLDRNHFRSVLRDEGGTMRRAFWPLILQEVNRKLAMHQARRTTILYELLHEGLYYGIMPSTG